MTHGLSPVAYRLLTLLHYNGTSSGRALLELWREGVSERMSQNTLWTALMRLGDRGMVRRLEPEGPRNRGQRWVYRITRLGERALEEQREEYRELAEFEG